MLYLSNAPFKSQEGKNLGGYSTMVWVGVSGSKGRKWGLVEWINAKLVELIFFFFWKKKCCFQKDFQPKLRLPELNFDRILGLRTENLSKLGILNGKLRNFIIFLLKWRSCGTEKCWKGGFVERLREHEKGALSLLHIPVTLFKVKYWGGGGREPPPPSFLHSNPWLHLHECYHNILIQMGV